MTKQPDKYEERRLTHPSLELASSAHGATWSAGRHLDAVGSVYHVRVKPRAERIATIEAAILDINRAKILAEKALSAARTEAEVVKAPKPALTAAKVYAALRKHGLHAWKRATGRAGAFNHGEGDVTVEIDGDVATVETYHGTHARAVLAAEMAGFDVSENRPPTSRGLDGHRGSFRAKKGGAP